MTKNLKILSPEAPIVCTIEAFSPSERAEHVAETEALFATVLAVRVLPDGYALRLPAEPAVLGRILAWALRERRCCSFFTFRLEIEPGDDAAWLQITGPDGAKETFAEGLRGLSAEAAERLVAARAG